MLSSFSSPPQPDHPRTRQRSRRSPTTQKRCIVVRWPTKRLAAGRVSRPLSPVRSLLRPASATAGPLRCLITDAFLDCAGYACADYNKLATLPDVSPLLADQIKAAQRRLPDKVRAQQDKEKDEVIGKLKDLGNTLLGASSPTETSAIAPNLSLISYLRSQASSDCQRTTSSLWSSLAEDTASLSSDSLPSSRSHASSSASQASFRLATC